MNVLKSMRKLYAALVCMSVLVLTVRPVLAQTNGTGTIDITGGVIGQVNGQQLAQKITSIATGLAAIVGAAALISLVFNAIKMIAAADDERKRSEAMSGIRYTLIGVAIAGLAFLIVGFVVFLVMGQS